MNELCGSDFCILLPDCQSRAHEWPAREILFTRISIRIIIQGNRAESFKRFDRINKLPWILFTSVQLIAGTIWNKLNTGTLCKYYMQIVS